MTLTYALIQVVEKIAEKTDKGKIAPQFSFG